MRKSDTRRWSDDGLQARALHVAAAVVGSAVVGGVASSAASKSAANKASKAQTDSAAMGVAEQQRQFDALQKLLQPYVQAGTGVEATGPVFDGATYLAQNPDVAADPYFAQNPEEHFRIYGWNEGRAKPMTQGTPGQKGALQSQQDLIGLNGAGAQQSAIDQLKTSPAFTSLLAQGENSILQNASATGGLRGGNTQAALAQFSPALLAQTINDQYARLGGLTQLGQNSAAMTGSAGMAAGSGISALLQQQGAAQAGNALAQGQATAGMWNSLAGGVGTFAGLGRAGASSAGSGFAMPSYDSLYGGGVF